MKKYITIFFLVFGTAFIANAQVSIAYSAGYGSYKMGDMRRILEISLSNIRSQLPNGVRITDNFPGYITHNIDATYRFKRHEIGLKGTYMTTGGKIAYSDYSGKYNETITLNGYRVGAMYRFHFLKTQISDLPFSLYGEISPAITFTGLRYGGLLELPDYEVKETNQNNDLNTDEIGFSAQPLVGAQLLVSRNFFVYCSTGYDFEFGAKLTPTNDALRVDWSGFRGNLGIGFKW